MSLPDLRFLPLLPDWLLLAIALAALTLLWIGRRHGLPPWPRLISLLLLLLALINPTLITSVGSDIGDIALIVVDDSASMHLGNRPEQSARAVAALQKQIDALPHVQSRLVTVGNQEGNDQGTRLFAAVNDALADIPAARLAGVILVTDGQVHDLPEPLRLGAPLHVLLAGSRQDRDRRLVLDSAAGFTMVGQSAELAFHVEDLGHEGSAAVTVRRDGAAALTIDAPLNHSSKISLPIDHAGANVIEVQVAPAPGELTLDNNRAAVSISGVRDRLRVLLLSGEPHPGERMWRNLLKADPMVDLVHFTILRSPDKEDHTPLQQLSLIAFPTRELFEERLKDFDLIIFDRFRRRSILPPAYYRNIAEHVRQGGALLLVAGPELGAPDGLAGSALSEILPAKPTGSVISAPFLPLVTEVGKRHPLLQGLANGDPPRWGRWVRAAGSRASPESDIVMATPDGLPLLVLAHAGDGRVAQLNSDSAWLWGRGWDGGGPQAELLRRLAHWLMKEPELEENRLSGAVAAGTLQIERQSLEPGDRKVSMIRPDGSQTHVALADQGDGHALGRIPADQNGLWRLADDQLTSLVAVGSLDTVEMGDVRATTSRLQPAVSANGGGIAWLEDGQPGILLQPKGAQMSGTGWFGLRANGQRSITSSAVRPLLPGWLMLSLIVASLAWAWRQESRR